MRQQLADIALLKSPHKQIEGWAISERMIAFTTWRVKGGLLNCTASESGPAYKKRDSLRLSPHQMLFRLNPFYCSVFFFPPPLNRLLRSSSIF